MHRASLLAALLALPAAAQDPPPVPPGASAPAPQPAATPAAAAAKLTGDPDARPASPAAVLEEVTGTVSAVDRTAQKLEITTAKGPVTLHLDRNTLVYAQGSLGTVLDLAPGQPVRAGRNAAWTAYWVQLRPPAAKAPPAQGAGPNTSPAPGAVGGTTPPPGTGTPAAPSTPPAAARP